jgi:hypothetical protein
VGSTPAERVVDSLILFATVGFAVLSFFTIWAIVPLVLMLVAGERLRLAGRARRSARRSQGPDALR